MPFTKMTVLSIEQITAVELAGMESRTLQPAYEALLARWREEHDRETGLRLLFLAWYHTAEPDYLTGLSDPDAHLVAASVFRALRREIPDDGEFFLVSWWMIELFPYAFDGRSERAWSWTARSCRRRTRRLGVTALPPETFAGRGAYGEYFEQMAPHMRTRP
jgi:hypothetical protein